MATKPPYGYRKSELDKNVWEIDEDAAAIVRRIFKMCIDGYGPEQIAKRLTADNILIPSAYSESKGNNASRSYKYPTRWGWQTIARMLENLNMRVILQILKHTGNLISTKSVLTIQKRNG